METNQTTCPQCGLVNNYLSETCAQCGLIFVKNQITNDTEALRDEQKRKAIEAAEAILDETLPPSETAALGNDMVGKMDLPEDTVEMQIPVEAAGAVPEGTKLEENREPQTHEIEMEAIEASPQNPAEATDAETLFLSEMTTIPTAAVVESDIDEADLPPASVKAADSRGATVNLDTVTAGGPDQNIADMAAQHSEAAPAGPTPLEENSVKNESDTSEFEGGEPAKFQASPEEVIEAAEIKDDAVAEAEPVGQKVPLEAKPQSDAGFEETIQSEARIQQEPTVEMSQAPAEAQILVKKQELKPAEKAQVRQEQEQVLAALKRQREKQAKAQASSKEQAGEADAGAFEKKKLAMAKAEALRRHKAAQAKAEALKKQKAAKLKALALKKQMAKQARLEVLKKQKAAQAGAEASAREMEVASVTAPPTAAKGASGNHVRLLNLLKRYKGKAIGINYDNSAEIKEAELVDANEEFFSVMVKDKKLHYSYPLKTILTIVEGQEGVETGDENRTTKFDAVIKVYPLVLFK